MRPTISAAAMVLAMTLVLAAQTLSAQPAAGQACSLLTKEDAAAALGEAVQGPRSKALPGGPSSCEYSGSGINRVHLNVIPFTAEQAAIYKGMCAQKGKQGLTGLGDVTCWYNDKHEELQVAKGLTFVSIELRRSGDPTEPIKAVARKVYDKLK
jgi:hypothetical protein